MRLLTITFLIFLSQLLWSQPGFIKILGDPFPTRWMTDLIVENDTIITFASSKDTILNTQGILFEKFDKNGNHILSNVISDKNHLLTGQSFRKNAINTEDGGYCYIGGGWRTDTSDYHFNYFIKVNHELNLETLKYFNIEPSHNSSHVETSCETKNGFFIFISKNDQRILIKTDKIGNEQWRKNYGQPNLNQKTIKIKKVDDNTFIVSGGNYYNDEAIGGFELFAIDSLGMIKWHKEWFSTDEYNYLDITDFEKLPDGGWIFCGIAAKYSFNVGGIEPQAYIFRVDKDFNILWEKGLFDVHLYSYFMDLEKTIDGNFIATGSNFGVWPIHYKFSIDGDKIWSRQDRIGEGFYFDLYASGVLSNGSIVSGGSDVSGEGEHRGLYGFLMKITNDGCIDISECPDWTAVEVISKAQIDIDIFPNPTSNYVTLSKVNEVLQKPIDIEIFDVMGHKVKDTTIPIFEQNINLDISNLANGVYFCRFYQDGTLLFVKKLIKQ